MMTLKGMDQPNNSEERREPMVSGNGAITDKPSLFGSTFARAALGIEAEAYVVRVSEMMDRARAIVQGDRVQAVNLLNAKRVRLFDHLGNYQRFKHTQIFNPVIERAPASSRVVARTMKIDCMALGETFAGYHNRWLGLRPDEWPAYRRDMLVTTEAMQVNINAEIRAIRQLLMISDLYAD